MRRRVCQQQLAARRRQHVPPASARGPPLLPKVVDVVVRCFDPSLPKIREACFKSAMSVVHEMCPAYPMMSLYRPSARLAVGGPDGLINIYDLKSATRWQAIPAHSSPITALA